MFDPAPSRLILARSDVAIHSKSIKPYLSVVAFGLTTHYLIRRDLSIDVSASISTCLDRVTGVLLHGRRI